MARIIYGVAGEGRGHSSRSKIVIEYLQSKGHEVKIFGYNKSYTYLSKFFDDVNKIDGPELVYSGSSVVVSETFKKNFKKFSKDGLKNLGIVIRSIKSFKPHFAISDFETFVPRACRLNKIPLYALDHQGFIGSTDLEYLYDWRDVYLHSYLVVRNMCMPVDMYYNTSFFFPKIRKKSKSKFKMFGPILRNEVLEKNPSNGDHILVYVTTSKARKILSLIKQLPFKFVAYGFKNQKSTKQITFKKPSTETFLNDLASCNAVITGGGYTLFSEALFFGKPIYSVPIKSQFEQMVNGFYLEKQGYGLYDLDPTLARLTQFFEGTPYFKRNIERDSSKFNGNKAVFRELDKLVKKHAQK
ncbi:hypothetical protein H8D36_06655 [archaeon]|nr:hypothetical protein [archaeon]